MNTQIETKEWSRISPFSKRVYYFTEENYATCNKLTNQAGNILSENEFYRFIDSLMKILSYDSAKY